ncbi:MAG TPA: hypothetical protein VES93_12750 [Ornithinibacter sp.]|nr:hypothetical protein [Ornithinibacter sp.]
MTISSITPVRRAAVVLVLAGAGLGLAGGGAAWAAPVACGTPAHPALYSTTHHDAVPAVTHDVKVIDTAFVPGQAAVPAVTHDELVNVDGDGTPEGEGWRATGTTWTIVDTPAYTDYGWMRTIIDRAGVPGSPAVPAVTHEETVVDKAAWDEKVIDSPAVPAVDEVSHEETVVDKAAWDEKVIDSPAVPAVKEVSHWVTVVDKAAWDETVVEEDGYAYRQKKTGKITYKDTPSWNGEDNHHGNDYGWSRYPERDKTRVIHHKAVTHQEKVITTPASPAKPEVSHIVHHPAVTHTVTVVDVPEVPAVEAVEELSHVETGWTRDMYTAPEGEGWYLSGETIEHEAVTHVRYEWTRTIIDVPAVDAVPEVAEVSHMETIVDVPEVAAWDEQVLVSEATPAGPACPTDPVVVDTAVLGATAPITAVSAATNPAAVPTQVLAQTGSDLAVPLGAGLAFVVIGGGLVAAGRSRRA